MKDFNQLLEEARVEREAEERKRNDVFLGVIDRARVEQMQREREDPMLMWNVANGGKKVHKVYDAENPGVIAVPDKEESYIEGLLGGVLLAGLMALMVLIAWWTV